MEVAYTTGTNLAEYRLLFYDGASGSVYKTFDLSSPLSVTNSDPSGFSFSTFQVFTFSSQVEDGPDGIAVVNSSDEVVDFISYGGEVTATSGPAAGLTATLMGVTEAPNTGPQESLQLSGTGFLPSDFTWQPPQLATPGSPNTGQTFVCPEIVPETSSPTSPPTSSPTESASILPTKLSDDSTNTPTAAVPVSTDSPTKSPVAIATSSPSPSPTAIEETEAPTIPTPPQPSCEVRCFFSMNFTLYYFI